MIYNAILVSHTHWDREWYFTLEEYRFRLARMFDSLLDIIESEPDYHSFWLDGQIIPIDDYLAVRPENRARLERAIRGGKILVGPWHVLADELLVGGESFIRNLLYGMQRMRDYGQDNMIGYLPDTFGHISQAPQLLRGFGIDNAIFSRGFSADDLDKSETFWRGADGSLIRAVCLVQGYWHASDLAGERDRLAPDLARQGEAERVEYALPKIIEKASSPVILLMNGIDHGMPARGLAAAARRLEAEHPFLRVRHGSLREYLRAVQWRRLRRKGRGCLRGELTYAPGLDGTLSARTWLKIMNRECENQLSHYAEPLAAWAWADAEEEHPAGFIRRAWNLVIENHPHDTICGCHADGVARDAAVRFGRAREIANVVTRRSLGALIGYDETRHHASCDCALNVYQPLGFPTRRAMEVLIDLPAESRLLPAALASGRNSAPLQIVSQETVYRRAFHEHINPTVRQVKRFAAVAAPVELPAASLTSLAIALAPAPLCAVPLAHATRSKTGVTLSNEMIAAEVKPDGTMDVKHLATGRKLRGLNRLVIEGDAGDLYHFAPSKNEPPVAAHPARMQIIEQGPVRAAALVRLSLRLRRKRIPVSLRISLSAGDDFVAVQARIENSQCDHRIQALFPLPKDMRQVRAHMPFDMVKRGHIPESELTMGKTQALQNCSCQALQLMVSASGKRHSLILPTKGLCEYTHLKPGRLALTLMRSVGAITPNLASHTASQGQCPGTNIAEYGIGLTTDTSDAALLRKGLEFSVPPASMQSFDAPPHPARQLLHISNSDWMLSCVKRSEDGGSLITRVFSLAPGRGRGVLRPGVPFRAAWQCRVDEKRLKRLKIRGGAVALSLKPREIATVRFDIQQP